MIVKLNSNIAVSHFVAGSVVTQARVHHLWLTYISRNSMFFSPFFGLPRSNMSNMFFVYQLIFTYANSKQNEVNFPKRAINTT